MHKYREIAPENDPCIVHTFMPKIRFSHDAMQLVYLPASSGTDSVFILLKSVFSPPVM